METKVLFSVNISAYVKGNSFAFIFEQQEFNDFSKPHGQSYVCGAATQYISCDARGHGSGALVSKKPGPSPADSCEPTWFDAVYDWATCTESLERGQNLRGK